MGSIRKTYEEAQKTRDEILRAGIAACTRSGYDGLSLAQMAEDAGVTRGALYHHFAGKKGLLREMVEALLTEMGAAIETAANREADGWAALEAGCRCFLRESQQPEYQRIVMTDGPAVLGIAEWRELDFRHTTRTLAEALTELAGQGEIDVPDSEAAAEALAGAMNQLSLWVAAGNPKETAWRTLERLLEALRCG